MKKQLKLLVALFALGAGTLTLSSCDNTGGGEEPAKEVKLTAAYLSPAKMVYMNMRPTYNYYITTFIFQELETYDDNSYVLTVSSSTYSGLDLPNEGNDAKGNERENSLQKFYGTYTSKANDLDPDTLEISLTKPTRFVNVEDSKMYYDTANWTDDMSKKAGTVTDPMTGESTVNPLSAAEYLAKYAFKDTVISASKINFSFDYTELVVEK